MGSKTSCSFDTILLLSFDQWGAPFIQMIFIACEIRIFRHLLWSLTINIPPFNLISGILTVSWSFCFLFLNTQKIIQAMAIEQISKIMNIITGVITSFSLRLSSSALFPSLAIISKPTINDKMRRDYTVAVYFWNLLLGKIYFFVVRI